MGKYIGSPWGEIRGKLDDAVGGVWKGISWVRVRVLPTQRGTLQEYRLWKEHPEEHPFFSLKQMNIRRLSLQVLGYLARVNMINMIRPIWDELALKRGWKESGLNSFVKRNAAALYYSMNNINAEFDPSTNTPDLKIIKMADGDVEGTPILTAVYVTGTGILTVTWDETCYTNGELTDLAYVMVVKKPILESIGITGTWYPALYLYGQANVGSAITRDDESFALTLPAGLTAADLTAYLFFRKELDESEWSPSASLQVTV